MTQEAKSRLNDKDISTPTSRQTETAQLAKAPPLPKSAAAKDFFDGIKGKFNAKQRRHIQRAAEKAAQLHEGQLRADEQPYIVHPLAVAGIVASWLRDEEAVISALLHDVVEDTPFTSGDVAEQFGATVANIVDGVTNIEKIEHIGGEQRRADNFRKMLLAVANDWRVLLIKLADRIHNMRTLYPLPKKKRMRIANETLEIYAPLAERLGFRAARDELQLLAFEHLMPLRFKVLEQALERSAQERRNALPAIESKLEQIFASANIKATLEGRSKNLYSIYRKMIEKRLRFTEVDDITGFRILVSNRAECYQVLGIIHEHFRPLPFKVKDYIGMPKSNGYQSLHTTVLDRSGILVELQIRTALMHEFAEQGLAAHWHYKQTNNSGNDKARIELMQQQASRVLAGLADLPTHTDSGHDFLADLRIDLFPNDIFVMSPKGRVVHLPKGASALDFAFEIHTELGSSAEAAEINGKTLPVSAKLASGDIVKIITSSAAHPHPQWLNFVVSSKARNRIRSVLRQSWSDEIIDFGSKLLDHALNRLGNSLDQLPAQAWQSFFTRSMADGNRELLLSELALGKMDAFIVAKELVGPESGERQRRSHEARIEIARDKQAGITFAECCCPLPPEPIVGLMHKGTGMIVHRSDCRTLRKDKSSAISLTWSSDTGTLFKTKVTLECTNRRKLFADVLQAVRSAEINIADVRLTGGEASSPVAVIELVVEVEDARQTERLLRKLEAIPGVQTAQRAGSVSFS